MVTAETARHWLQQQITCELVTIVTALGSVPRGTGTAMLVAADRVAGTIGGGHLEFEAIASARRRLAQADATIARERFSLGPRLGQCCGGVVELEFRCLAPADADRLQQQEQARLTPLLLCGAGHIGRALVDVLQRLPFDICWIDERADQFPPVVPTHVRTIVTDTPEAEIAAAPAQAFFLVMTHSHALDEALCHEILKRDFAYCGLIGSATKRARFLHRLIARGIAPAAVARMRCPIGIPNIAGKEPEIIAIAVAAELLQERSRLQAAAVATAGAAVLHV
jgi:xanthine dehydrogenase accessory factor